MRYRLPDDCAGLSFAGKQIAVAADRTVDLDAAAAAALLPHGIVRAETPPAKSAAADAGPTGKRPER